MQRTTRKLSGQAKDRLIERLVAEEAEIEQASAARLVARLKAVLTSVRIRRGALAGLRRWGGAWPATVASPQIEAAATPGHSAPAVSLPAPAPAPAAGGTPFDPYVFGLVPVFQREGREGLLAKLGTIVEADDLRAMARTQKIVLPAELRSGTGEPEQLRQAIAEAVARRVADRKAAAG